MDKRYLHIVFLLAVLVFVSNCGGGGTSGGGTPPVDPPPPPPPAGDFTLAVDLPSIALQQGGALELQIIQANPINGFTGTIQLTLSGLPNGVTGLPAGPYSIVVGGASQGAAIRLGAASSTAIGTSSVTVTGTSGTTSHTATFSVNVSQAAPWRLQVSPPSVSLTPGTSATVTVSVISTAQAPPQLEVGLPDTNGLIGVNITNPQGFLTPSSPVTFIINPTPQAQPLTNYPFVLTATDTASSNTGIFILPLTVTVPFSANTSPTRSTFARTDKPPTGMVYDQARKMLFVSVEILNEVVVLSTVDGHQVASIPVNFPAGIDESVDGNSVYVVSPYFDGITIIDPNLLQVVGHVNVPATVSGNSLGRAFFQVATLSNGNVVLLEAGELNGILLWTPSTNDFTAFGNSAFLLAAGLISRSADHTKLLGSAGFGGAILYDVNSGTFTAVNSSIGNYAAISPDGSQVISVGLQNSPTVFYDANLNPIASMEIDAFPIGGVAYSLNGRYAYVFTQQNDNGGNIATIIDTSKFSVVGLVPGFGFSFVLPFSGQWITTFAEDETGMLFGATQGGVGFLDMTEPTSLAYPLPQGFFVQPTLASISSATPAQLNGAGLAPNYTYNLFVGAAPASPQSLMASNVSVQSTTASVAIPKGATAGPANVTLTRSDGFFEVMPDAVTFGPTVLRVDADAGSSSGGDSIKIVGYGFDAGNPAVIIGGKTATISQTFAAIPDQFFPTESLTVTTPAGLAGNADVVVSTSSGSTTVAGGFQYLDSVQVYPKTGTLDAIVYDQPRQRLYVTNQDHNEVEIFDLTSKTFLPPISVGNGPASLALTPDGRLLAVLNFNDATVTVVDPVKMRMTATYPVLTATEKSIDCGGVAFDISPAEPHRMMVEIQCTASLFGGEYHLLNLDTGSITCTGVVGCATNGTDINFSLGSMASTSDGSKVFLATSSGGGSDVQVGLLNLTANTLTNGFAGNFGDAAINADATVFAANFETSDSQLNAIAIMAFEPYADSGSQSFNNVIGEKLSPAGSLLFVPQTSGVDVFDVHNGRLVQHVVLPDPIPLDSNAMALDETGTKMFLTSSTGVTIAELNQAPLSIGTLSPVTGPSGTTVKLRGSGFVTGAVVTFGTTRASATFVDLNTLQATVPSLSAGAVRVTVTNPDGHQYTLDNAFTVN